MQKVVIDTNVLVSALISKSYPYLIISDILRNKNIEWCLSGDVLLEYQAVLRRPKFLAFPDFAQRAEQVLLYVESVSVFCTPQEKLDILTDKDDNKFLELAASAKAHFLITGNTSDFTLERFENTLIVGPKDYWEKGYLNAGK